jgi:hypothetical protein
MSELTSAVGEIYQCCKCSCDERGFAVKCFERAANGLYKKHPPIGNGRKIVFVNINPRLTRNESMEWAMRNEVSFRELSRNRFKGLTYIPGIESFYNIHERIAAAIAPGAPFEKTATIWELYLCATRPGARLPGSLSPCANRYLWPDLVARPPELIITFGADPADFFCCSPEDKKAQRLDMGGKTTYVLPVAFRRAWPRELDDAVVEWARSTFLAVQAGDPVPERTFDWPRRSERDEVYALCAQTPEVVAKVRKLPPQAQACVRIMVLGGKLEYGKEELRTLIEQHSISRDQFYSPEPLHTDQDPWRIFTYYRKRLIAIGAIELKSNASSIPES